MWVPRDIKDALINSGRYFSTGREKLVYQTQADSDAKRPVYLFEVLPHSKPKDSKIL